MTDEVMLEVPSFMAPLSWVQSWMGYGLPRPLGEALKQALADYEASKKYRVENHSRIDEISYVKSIDEHAATFYGPDAEAHARAFAATLNGEWECECVCHGNGGGSRVLCACCTNPPYSDDPKGDDRG